MCRRKQRLRGASCCRMPVTRSQPGPWHHPGIPRTRRQAARCRRRPQPVGGGRPVDCLMQQQPDRQRGRAAWQRSAPGRLCACRWLRPRTVPVVSGRLGVVGGLVSWFERCLATFRIRSGGDVLQPACPPENSANPEHATAMPECLGIQQIDGWSAAIAQRGDRRCGAGCSAVLAAPKAAWRSLGTCGEPWASRFFRSGARPVSGVCFSARLRMITQGAFAKRDGFHVSCLRAAPEAPSGGRKPRRGGGDTVGRRGMRPDSTNGRRRRNHQPPGSEAEVWAGDQVAYLRSVPSA